MVGFGLSARLKPMSEHVQIVALYEPADGRITHLHMVTTLGEATPLSVEQAIDEARRRARRHVRNADDLGVALSDNPDHARALHRIDPASKTFVPDAGEDASRA